MFKIRNIDIIISIIAVNVTAMVGNWSDKGRDNKMRFGENIE